jgi:outer membrane protein TolC
MMRRGPLWIVLCAFLLPGIGPSLLFSQEAPPEKVWTLEECIQVALKNRPELEFSNLDILYAEQQIKEAQSYYYPRVNLLAGYTHFNEPFKIDTNIDVIALVGPVNKFLESIGVEPLPSVLHESLIVGKQEWFAVNVDIVQPIYTFGRIKEGVQQARIGRSIAVNQKEKKRTEIVFEVKKGYYQYLLAKEIHQLLKEAEVGTDVVAKMVKIAYETAVPEEKEEKGTTRLDYLKARNFHSEVKAKLSEMEKNLKLAQLGLKMAMGLYNDSPVKIAAAALGALPMSVWGIEELKGRVQEKNLDLKTVDLGVQFLDSRQKSATKEYFPKIGLFGNYTGPEDRFGNPNLWIAGVALTMPLFDGFLTKAKVGQARAQLEKVKGQKMLLESALSVQMDHLHTTLSELKERAAIYRDSLKEVRERVQLAADGYASGITEYEDLLLSQKAEIEMQANYLHSLFQFQMTKAEIEFISGIQ